MKRTLLMASIAFIPTLALGQSAALPERPIIVAQNEKPAEPDAKKPAAKPQPAKPQAQPQQPKAPAAPQQRQAQPPQQPQKPQAPAAQQRREERQENRQERREQRQAQPPAPQQPKPQAVQPPQQPKSVAPPQSAQPAKPAPQNRAQPNSAQKPAAPAAEAPKPAAPAADAQKPGATPQDRREQRQDTRQDNRQQPQDNREQRQDTRQDKRQDNRQDARQERREDRKLDALRAERKETKQGNQTVIRERDRTIIREGNRTIVRHDDETRFRRAGANVKEVRRGNNTERVIVRPNGVRVVTVVDNNGRTIRRSRFVNGREYVLFTNRPSAGFGFIVNVGPPVIRIPRERYIVEYRDAPPPLIYDTLIAEPVMPLERVYSLDEVRYNYDVRARMPRIDIDSINFETGSWDVAPDQADKLAPIAEGMKRAIAKNPNEVFMVEGHTDAVGSDDDNLLLSDRRAQAVTEILTEDFGVPPENMIPQGYGEQNLKVETDGPEVRNRYVSVRRVTPLLANNQ